MNELIVSQELTNEGDGKGISDIGRACHRTAMLMLSPSFHPLTSVRYCLSVSVVNGNRTFVIHAARRVGRTSRPETVLLISELLQQLSKCQQVGGDMKKDVPKS